MSAKGIRPMSKYELEIFDYHGLVGITKTIKLEDGAEWIFGTLRDNANSCRVYEFFSYQAAPISRATRRDPDNRAYTMTREES